MTNTESKLIIKNEVGYNNTNRSDCMEKCRGGNGGQKHFQKTEVEGPGFLFGAS